MSTMEFILIVWASFLFSSSVVFGLVSIFQKQIFNFIWSIEEKKINKLLGYDAEEI